MIRRVVNAYTCFVAERPSQARVRPSAILHPLAPCHLHSSATKGAKSKPGAVQRSQNNVVAQAGGHQAGAPASVCVLGAGVVGLTSALRLCQDVPGIQVTVLAEKWDVNTTSDGAGGLWKPYAAGSTPAADIVRWGQRTFDHYLEIYRSPDAGTAGVILTSSYVLLPEPQPDPVWRDIVPHFRPLTEREISAYDASGLHSAGYFFTTVITEGRLYMAWLTAQLQHLGAKLVTGRVESVGELGGYDVVVNCTGLGARELWDDDTMYPIRGQVLRVRAPWVRHYINAGGFPGKDCYIIPNSDTVVVGGTQQVGDWELNPRQEDTEGILQRACAVLPSLAKAEVVREWVGLRPGRPAVRLEAEQRRLDSGRTLPVVHCYGHGGSGLTLAWGCAEDVVMLVRQALGK